jgi:hypothetical protein
MRKYIFDLEDTKVTMIRILPKTNTGMSFWNLETRVKRMNKIKKIFR